MRVTPWTSLCLKGGIESFIDAYLFKDSLVHEDQAYDEGPWYNYKSASSRGKLLLMATKEGDMFGRQATSIKLSSMGIEIARYERAKGCDRLEFTWDEITRMKCHKDFTGTPKIETNVFTLHLNVGIDQLPSNPEYEMVLWPIYTFIMIASSTVSVFLGKGLPYIESPIPQSVMLAMGHKNFINGQTKMIENGLISTEYLEEMEEARKRILKAGAP